MERGGKAGVGGQVGLEQLLGQADWVRALARHLAGAAGDDVAQETFLAAHRAPPDPARPPRPWLGQVVRNLVGLHRRGEGRRQQREALFAQGLPQAAAGVDEVYERLELDRFLAERVMALDESLRTVVVLRYYEGLDSPRIAALTKTPAGTVRWRLQQALERLRADLDQRHGDRRAWSALILPALSRNGVPSTGALIMGTASVSKNWFALVILLVLLAGLGGLGGWRVWASRAGHEGGGAAGRGDLAAEAPAAAGAGPGRGGLPRLIAAGEPDSEGTLAGCLDAFSAGMREARLRDEEARAVVPEVAFELGAPNHRLRSHIQPQVDRIMKDAGTRSGLVQDVECRSWACRITLVVVAVESNEVEPRLAAMEQWVPRARQLSGLRMGSTDERPNFSFGGRRSSRDPLTRRMLEEYVFFVGLPPASLEAEADPMIWGMQPPTTLGACTRALSLVRERITSRNALLTAHRPPQAAFSAAQRAPHLPEGVQEAVTHALGAAGARLECRGAVCRLPQAALSMSAQAALERLAQEPALDDRLLVQEIAPTHLYFTIAAETIPALLSRLRAPLRAPEFFSECADPPQEGNLLLRLVIPATGETNEDGVAGRMSVTLVGGSLADAPSARCFMARYGQAVANRPLPAPIGNLMRFESWQWRPGEPPRMVTPPPL